jgi:glutathione S-transferase
MDLYFSYTSTYSQKVLLGFYEKSVPFNPQRLDLGDRQAHARYREFYPFGKVPLLVRDDGRMIPESSIILEYIDHRFPRGPQLIPADHEQALHVRLLDRMCDQFLNDPVVTLILESWKLPGQQNVDVIDNATEKVGLMYRYLGDHLEGREFLAGDHFTLADCAAIPPLYYARAFADFASIDNLQRYWERVSQRPALLKLQNEAKPYVQALMGAQT